MPLRQTSFLFFFFNPHLRKGRGEGEKKRGREGEREKREVKEKCLPVASVQTRPGIEPQPRYVPWPGTEPEHFVLWDKAPSNGATFPGQANIFMEKEDPAVQYI